VGLALAIALAIAAPPQAFGADAELERGIRLVEDGDYDAAILTLDGVARRLAAEPSRVQELSQAYLYLGVAYVAKGHEAAAKAKFREAVSRIKDLTLSPDKFPPKVIDLFEAARAEESATGAGTARPKKGGGAKRPLILAGLGAAAAASSLLVCCDPEAPPPTTSETFTAVLTAGDHYRQQVVGPAGAAGTWQAELSWSNALAAAILEVYSAGGDQLARGRRLGGPSVVVDFPGQAGATYRFDFYFDSDASPDPGPVQLRVTRPR
jgi:hypothetical protein